MNEYSCKALAARQTPRIFCIGRNYAKHMAELGNADSQPCVVFMKPLSALVAAHTEIPIPANQGSVHHEAELVVEIGRGGHDIQSAAARDHIAGIGLGLDLTLRDLQFALKASGEPWEKCKAFDHSAPLGSLRPLDTDIDLANLAFRLEVNGACRQQGHTGNMLMGICDLIARVSAHWRLLPGDLIYTGTPEGVGTIQAGDALTLSGPGLATAHWTVTSGLNLP